METIKYTLTLEDCRDYVKYQRKIPRTKRVILKQFLPLFYICTGMLLIGLFYEIVNFFMSVNSVSAQYSLTIAEIYKSNFVWAILEGVGYDFVSMSVPILLIWLVIFALAWNISAQDMFHVESSKVYDGLKDNERELEITVQDEGLLCTGKNLSTLYKWTNIVDVYDTKKSILVFVDKYSALIIPHRAFASSEEAAGFFRLLKEKLNRK